MQERRGFGRGDRGFGLCSNFFHLNTSSGKDYSPQSFRFSIYVQLWTYPVRSLPLFLLLLSILPPLFPSLSPSPSSCLPSPIPLFPEKPAVSSYWEPTASSRQQRKRERLASYGRWGGYCRGMGCRMEGSSGKDLEGFGSVQRRIILPNVVPTVSIGSICHMGFFLRLFLVGHVC